MAGGGGKKNYIFTESKVQDNQEQGILESEEDGGNFSAIKNKIQRSKEFVEELKSYGTLIRSKTLVD